MISKADLVKYLDIRLMKECKEKGIEYTGDYILSISDERKKEIARELIEYGTMSA